jgi:hypothetical protein
MGQIKKTTNFPYAWLSCQTAARNFQVLQIRCTRSSQKLMRKFPSYLLEILKT